MRVHEVSGGLNHSYRMNTRRLVPTFEVTIKSPENPTDEGENMIRTVEAVIDKNGNVRLLEAVRHRAARRALVIILEEAPATQTSEGALLSEEALAQDWERPEEDEAWSDIPAGAVRRL